MAHKALRILVPGNLLTSSPPPLPIAQSSSATLASLFLKHARQAPAVGSVLALPSAWNSLPQGNLIACYLASFRYLLTHQLPIEVFSDALTSNLSYFHFPSVSVTY